MILPTLDQKAAQYAQLIIKEAKRKGQQERMDAFITKALAVLQEQGAYACMLFLYSRPETERLKARIVIEQLCAILKMLKEEYKIIWEDSSGKIHEAPECAKDDVTAEKVLKFYADVVPKDLDTLLLVRDLYEQTLIYARYAAKAEQNGG